MKAAAWTSENRGSSCSTHSNFWRRLHPLARRVSSAATSPSKHACTAGLDLVRVRARARARARVRVRVRVRVRIRVRIRVRVRARVRVRVRARARARARARVRRWRGACRGRGPRT